MTMRTALVTCGGGLQGLAVIGALRRVPQMRVLVLDHTTENLGRYQAERLIVAPPISDEAKFLELILSTCRDEAVDVVLPSTEHELGLLARHAGQIRATGARLLSSPQAVLNLTSDKLELHRWLRSHELPSPETDADPAALEALLPLLGKPRRGFGGKGHRVLLTPDDVRLEGTQPHSGLVWQPMLTGFDEYSVDFAIDEAAAVSPLSIRRRTRTLSGFALMGDFARREDLESLAGRAARELARLGGVGLFNLQFICVGADNWITDLNPRVGTSLPLSLAAGFDPVGFLLGQATAAPEPGQRGVRFIQERVVKEIDAGQIRGVVFDLDDTLLDQKDWIARKLEGLWALRQHLLPGRMQFLELAYCLLEEGRRSDLLDAVCQQLDLEESVRRDLIEVYRAVVPDGCRLYGDVLPALDELRRRGYRLGLLTDNPAVSQRLKLSVARLADRFDGLVLTGELGQRKPAAACFDAAASSLALAPGRLAMVGDHLYRDNLGALRAGYAFAFQVRRQGSMFDFSTPRLAAGFQADRLVHIDSLTELFWHLSWVRT